VISNVTLSVAGTPLEATLSCFPDHVLVYFKEIDTFLLRYFLHRISCCVRKSLIHVILNTVKYKLWAGYLSRYNDWLRAGRSGDLIPVGARFSAPVQTGRGAHPASSTMGPGSFPGVEAAGAWG